MWILSTHLISSFRLVYSTLVIHRLNAVTVTYQSILNLLATACINWLYCHALFWNCVWTCRICLNRCKMPIHILTCDRQWLLGTYNQELIRGGHRYTHLPTSWTDASEPCLKTVWLVSNLDLQVIGCFRWQSVNLLKIYSSLLYSYKHSVSFIHNSIVSL